MESNCDKPKKNITCVCKVLNICLYVAPHPLLPYPLLALLCPLSPHTTALPVPPSPTPFPSPLFQAPLILAPSPELPARPPEGSQEGPGCFRGQTHRVHRHHGGSRASTFLTRPHLALALLTFSTRLRHPPSPQTHTFVLLSPFCLLILSYSIHTNLDFTLHMPFLFTVPVPFTPDIPLTSPSPHHFPLLHAWAVFQENQHIDESEWVCGSVPRLFRLCQILTPDSPPFFFSAPSLRPE